MLSATLAGVATAAWISLVRLSMSMRPHAEIPLVAFLVWCISGSRAFLAFLVDEGALMIVASTIVRLATFGPLAECLFHRRVRQVEPLLQEIDPQHPLHPDRRAGRRFPQDPSSRSGPCPLDIHADGHCLQSRPICWKPAIWAGSCSTRCSGI